jgi:hypothetical protein
MAENPAPEARLSLAQHGAPSGVLGRAKGQSESLKGRRTPFFLRLDLQHAGLEPVA